MVICLERGANDIHMVPLMPLLAYRGCFGKNVVKWMSDCLSNVYKVLSLVKYLKYKYRLPVLVCKKYFNYEYKILLIILSPV